MRVNHCRGNVAVPKQLLNRTNILPIFQQVGRETVPERMATGRFGHARLVDRSLDRVLKILFRNVMPTRFARPRIDGKFCRWENILPRPRFVRVWILPFQSEWKMNFPATIGEISLMKRTHMGEVQLKLASRALRQERQALPLAFSIAHRDLVLTEVDVLYAQTHTLH
jgi:hypothetical protein